MPYCPVCNSEFREGVTRCPDCEVPLVNENEEDFELDGEGDILEFFAVSDREEADLIKNLLGENDIESSIRISADGGSSDSEAAVEEWHIVITDDMADEARDIIQDAIDDETISDTGWFLVEEEEEEI